MKKTIKPFSVEWRRAGRKGSVAAKGAEGLAESAPQEAPPSTAWPDMPEPSQSDARRAADALFTRAVEPEAVRASVTPQPTRRVLQTLDEEDHIARLLEDEDAQRPRRGRKPLRDDALAPLPQMSARRAAPAIAAPAPALPQRIAGYIPGRIFARYARRTEPAPGKIWGKRPKPAW